MRYRGDAIPDQGTSVVRTQLSYINFKLAKVLGFHLTFLSSFEVSICLSMAKHVRQPTVRSVQPFVRYSPRDEAMKKLRCAEYRDQVSCSNSGPGRTQTLGPLLTRTSIGAVPGATRKYLRAS